MGLSTRSSTAVSTRGGKTLRIALGTLALLATGLAAPARAATIVSDTWQDSSRSEPAAPTYSEYGTDSDADGNIESAWFINSPSVAITPGHMTITPPTTSQNWTTYYTPEA